MSGQWTVFVEGRDDEHFIRCLLGHLAMGDVQIDCIGGGVSKLASVEPQIRRKRDAGRWTVAAAKARLSEILLVLDELKFGLRLLPQRQRRDQLRVALSGLIADYHDRILPLERTGAEWAARFRARSPFFCGQHRPSADDFATGTTDFNDGLLAETCRHNNWKLVTNDGDFTSGGIEILTTNRRLLAACK